ncbi:MAG: hypothetical protein WEB53_12485 [Akkermansiaceae bacterium]
MIRFSRCILLLTVPLAAENTRLEFALGVLEQTCGLDSAAGRFETTRLADPLALPLVLRADALDR